MRLCDIVTVAHGMSKQYKLSTQAPLGLGYVQGV